MKALYVRVTESEIWRPADYDPSVSHNDVADAINEYLKARDRIEAAGAYSDTELTEALKSLPDRPDLPLPPFLHE